MDQFKIEEVFESAVSIIRNLPKEGAIKPSDELKLKLYGLFKQATHGFNDTSKPRFYQVVELYKWDAWKKLGEMSKEDAMMNYIKELEKIMETIPPEQADEETSKRLEDVLGKKFYDYWFRRWNRAKAVDDSRLSGEDRSGLGYDGFEETNLETNQSVEDGYKTPCEFDSDRRQITQNSITRQLNDCFIDALFRLQLGLERTRNMKLY